MLADTMIPEAFEKVHNFSGLVMVIGFLTAYMLSKMEQENDPKADVPARPATSVLIPPPVTVPVTTLKAEGLEGALVRTHQHEQAKH
ncbi:hypothetical protein C1N53_06875 [Pontibacter sp. SGAir0037]|nr:hypothetical protein C1N53_06875 [Pontibacter sp. SGAir0037]